MNLAITARTRRSNSGFNPVPGIPFPYGTNIQTAATMDAAVDEKINIGLPVFTRDMSERDLIVKCSFDFIVNEPPFGTSAQFGANANTVLNWLVAPIPSRVKSKQERIQDALRTFYRLPETTAVGLFTHGEENEVSVFLNTHDRTEELLKRLIDLEVIIQGQMIDSYFWFHYIPLCGRTAQELAPPSTAWIEKQ